jgi:predicted nucleic acid-binding protein
LDFRAAFRTKERYRIPYWDAAIVEAARVVGCEVIYSEDLNDGQDFDGVRIENPFRESGAISSGKSQSVSRIALR